MSANDLDTVVGTYLERLDLALSAMPAPKRDQLVEEIAQHVAEGRRQLGEESPAALLQLLDRIGRPEDIAAAAFEEDEDRRLSFQGSGPGNRGAARPFRYRPAAVRRLPFRNRVAGRGDIAVGIKCVAGARQTAWHPGLSWRPGPASVFPRGALGMAHPPRGPAWSFWQCS